MGEISDLEFGIHKNEKKCIDLAISQSSLAVRFTISEVGIQLGLRVVYSQSNKLGQIYVKWYIKTQILRYVSACSVAR